MSQQLPPEERTGSQTVTTPAPPVLRLERNREPRHEVTWDENVVDNENLNRKKTKICCIFHPTDEDERKECDSSSDSSSDSSDNEDDKPNNDKPNKQRSNNNKPKPNAYEIQPSYTNRSHAPKKN